MTPCRSFFDTSTGTTSATSARELEAARVDVGDDDVPRADVARDRRPP